jgi:hypothetical protein
MKSQIPAPLACPLQVPTTATARSLLRIYVRLWGELEKAAAGDEVMMAPEEAQRAMENIEALMPLLGVNFDRSKLRPVRTLPKNGPLDFGELRSNILAVLRKAGDWLTYPEIADTILRMHSVEMTVAQRSYFVQKVREAIHALVQRGVLEKERSLEPCAQKGLQRVRLSQTLFRA